MVKNLVILVVFGLLAVNAVSAKKCYQCEDCPKVEDSQIKVCTDEAFPTPAPEVTTPAATTPEGTTPNAATPEVTTPTAATTAPQETKPKNTKDDNEDNDFRCLKYTNKDDKIVRSCTKRLCKTLEKEDDVKTCDICDGESCNFGTNIQSWAFGTIILVAIVKYLL